MDLPARRDALTQLHRLDAGQSSSLFYVVFIFFISPPLTNRKRTKNFSFNNQNGIFANLMHLTCFNSVFICSSLTNAFFYFSFTN